MVKKTVGHETHMKAAISKMPLKGEFTRKIKVTFLGAGSAFAPRVLNDIMMIEKNKGGSIALVDIDAGRLQLMKNYITSLIKKNDFKRFLENLKAAIK